LETEELEYQPSITFRSLKSLPVTWNWGHHGENSTRYCGSQCRVGNAMCETIARMYCANENRQSEAVNPEGTR